jgi:NADH:ubiquinone oxidoreductase subunit 5 (subunit L)/multisubunit Na+/H+ antiporter MnhA subunit
LIIGTVAGLTQNRIKRLLAYSTISHIGFILLALSIDSVESIQAFIFYLIQYSITNLNAFIILIAIGFSFYFYVNNNKQYGELEDKNNSPVQLTKQMKGYYYINGVLALSLTITVFSFVGIPPLIGFFGKQMVLSAALDSGYIFLSLIAILTSVISAVYYLNIIKELFFFKSENNKKLNYTISRSSSKAKHHLMDRLHDKDHYIELAYLDMLDYIDFKPAEAALAKYDLLLKDIVLSKLENKISNSKNTDQLAEDKLERNFLSLNTLDTDQSLALTEIFPIEKNIAEPLYPHKLKKYYDFLFDNVVLSSYLTISISVLSLSILLFIFQANELLNMANLLALNLNDTDK